LKTNILLIQKEQGSSYITKGVYGISITRDLKDSVYKYLLGIF